jgi:hypothetical protein
MQPEDRRFDSRGGLMIGLAALGAVLAPLGAGAQQQTQQQTPAQQQAQRPAVPPVVQRPAGNTQARPGTNGTINNVPATQNNALQNLLRGGTHNNTGTTNQQRPAINNLGTLLPNKTPNPGANNTAAANQRPGVGNPSSNKNLIGAPNGGAQPPHKNVPPQPNNPPPVAKQPPGPAVPSRTFIGHPAPPGTTEKPNRNGDIVRTTADGTVIDQYSPRNGTLIHHGLNGDRRVVVERPDHTRIVAASRGIQYVQHPYNVGGHTYINRTFYVNGKLTSQLYRPYTYGGTTYDVYAPSLYYEPRFYDWATSRQSTPQVKSLPNTAGNQPWLAYYKGVFTPEASYTSPAVWMADFLFATSLATHYQNNPPAPSDAPPADSSAGITPQVKQGVANEMTRQIKLESKEAQHKDPDPAATSVVTEIRSDRATHDFVANSDLDLVDPSGRRCMLSEGDVIEVSGGTPQPESSTVSAIVMYSKGGLECGRSAQVEVALTDLQEMQNHMRETADQAMAQTNAAKEVASSVPAFAASAPPADADAPQELAKEQQLAALADNN